MLTIKKRRLACQILAFLLVASLTACGPRGGRDLRRGERLIENGNAADAVPVLKDAVDALGGATRPVQAHAWNLLGLAYQGAGQWDAASQAYLKALQLDRDLVAADYNLGCLRLEQTNYPAAIDYLTTYTSLQPRSVEGFLYLGRARLNFGLERAGAEKARMLENARRDFEYAESLRSTALGCNALGLIDLFQHRSGNAEAVKAATAHFQLALQRDAHYAPAILNLAIMSQRYFNDPHEAAQKYTEYLSVQPSSPQAKEIEGIIRQLNIDSKITITPRAPTPAPSPVKTTNPPVQPVTQSQSPAPVERTEIRTSAPSPPYERPKAPVVTQPTYTPPRELQPPPYVAPAAPVARSSTPAPTPTTPRPNPAPVTATVSEPVAASPTPPPKKTFAQKLNPLHWFGKSKSEDEMSETFIPVSAGTSEHFAYPQPSQLIPGDRQTAERLTADGREAERRSDRARAILYYQESMKADPTYYPASLALGLAAIDQKDYPTALDALSHTLLLREDSADARYAFAWTLGKRGYYQDAANELEKLLASHPREVRAHLLLGNFYSGPLGQPKMAREHYLKAIELDPRNTQADAIRTWLSENP
jgi:tetratricopeptide (TPR) repeat protein